MGIWFYKKIGDFWQLLKITSHFSVIHTLPHKFLGILLPYVCIARIHKWIKKIIFLKRIISRVFDQKLIKKLLFFHSGTQVQQKRMQTLC